jgi:transcriptional antiterminator RfaH
MSAVQGMRWYVVQTQARCEARAACHLTRQGFTVYLPRYLKRRRHARRVEIVAAPLFPRYLFVAIDMSVQRWRAVRSTQGVSHLVCQGDAPAVVQDAVIAELQRREDERGLITLAATPRFAQGDKVRVMDGAFSDSFALFDGMTDDERVAVLIDLLGRKVRVKLDVLAIEAA